MSSDLSGLHLADMGTLIHAARCGSVSGAARLLGVTPSQASKAIARLEQALGQRLLVRGGQGVRLTDAGKRVLPRMHQLLEVVQRLAGSEPERPSLILMASAFLHALVVPPLAARLSSLQLACLEMPPGVASAYAAARLFDVALTSSAERWPGSWIGTRAGLIRKRLYAPPSLARRLGRPPLSPGQLRAVPFVTPIYSYNGQVMPGEDGCPLDAGERTIGHRTQTLSLALELAATAEQLVFAPELAARPWVASGALVEVPVAGWQVREPLQVLCHERLSAALQRRIVAAAREAMALGE